MAEMRGRRLGAFSVTLLALAALAGAQTVRADDNDIYASGTSAAINLASYRTDFSYADGNHRADISRYGIDFVQPLAPDVGFGLRGGYMTAGINNATLGSMSDGYGPFLGLFLSWRPMLGNYWSFDSQIAYTWYDLSYSGANQQADVTWYTSYVSAGPVLRLGRWQLAAGGYWQNISGHETDSGTVSERLNFSAAHATGAYFGFAYFLDQSGSLGAYVMSGARHGVMLVFKREF